MAVRTGRRVADRCAIRSSARRHRVLDPLGLLVDLVQGMPDVGEEALDHPVAADDVGGVLAAFLGEGQRLSWLRST